jgi:hypothetical protein
MTTKAFVSNEDYADVELAAHPNSGSCFYIEASSDSAMVTTFVALAAFFVMHMYAALRCPLSLTTKSEFYLLNKSNHNFTMDMDLSLTQVLDSHRFVAVNASLVTNDTQTDRSLTVGVTCGSMLMKGAITKHQEDPPKQTYELEFRKGINTSSQFPLIRYELHDLTSIQLKIGLQTHFATIIGTEFTWQFANPSADEYACLTRMLLSFLVAYMLVAFAFYLRFDSESFTQFYLLCLGIVGVLACNPVTFFFPEAPGTRVADHILAGLFFGMFKMFLVLEMEMLRSHNPRPKSIFVVSLSAIFALYATVEAAANYDRQTHRNNSDSEVPVILQSEAWVMLLHLFYVIGVVAYTVVAFLANDGINAKRMQFFAFAVGMTVLMLMFTTMFCVFTNFWMYTVRPALLYHATIATLAAFSIFVLHTGAETEYEGLDKVAEGENHVIEIDQISDGAGRGNGGDEEEDDSGEEEEEEE